MLTVFDGDSPNRVSGDREERCELGVNYHTIPGGPTPSAPTVFYHEGERLTTLFSIYLPSTYPLEDRRWQTVMQMKQASPSDLSTGGGEEGLSPALELDARGGRWRLYNDWQPIWSARARRGRWTRFAVQAYYTSSSVEGVPQGWLRVRVDLDGDGELSDPAESQPVIPQIQTLKAEVADPAGEASDTDGIAATESIPSHLRMGLYHDPLIPCPRPAGCSIEIDDVAVIGVPEP